MNKELIERKSQHLKNYDYSSTGVYFVTICTEGRKQILSKVIKLNDPPVGEIKNLTSVGEPLAAPENERYDVSFTDGKVTSFANRYSVRLTKVGWEVKEQLSNLEERFENLKIKDYVIMPDHIHM